MEGLRIEKVIDKIDRQFFPFFHEPSCSRRGHVEIQIINKYGGHGSLKLFNLDK